MIEYITFYCDDEIYSVNVCTNYFVKKKLDRPLRHNSLWLAFEWDSGSYDFCELPETFFKSHQANKDNKIFHRFVGAYTEILLREHQEVKMIAYENDSFADFLKQYFEERE